MPADDLSKGLLQRRRVQWTMQSDAERNMKRACSGSVFLLKPQTLLGVREWQVARARNGFNRQDCMLAAFVDLCLYQLRELLHRGRLEQGAHGQVHLQTGPHAQQHLGCEQRVTSQIEEVTPASHCRQSQHITPNTRDNLFNRTMRHELARIQLSPHLLERGQRLSIDLAV